MALKTIENKIKAVKKTRQVTKAMEAVSAVKMRKSQEKALLARPYAFGALSILEKITNRHPEWPVEHLVFREREMNTVLIVLITSDRGLAGILNTAVIRAAEALIRKHNLSNKNCAFITIGRKGYEYFTRRGYYILKNISYAELTNKETELGLEQDMLDSFVGGAYSHVYIGYSNFRSTFFQEPVLQQVLPLSVSALQKVVSGITPEKGKYAEFFKAQGSNGEKKISVAPYTYEPSEEEVFNSLIPSLLRIFVQQGLFEAEASEHSARMVAMKSAGDKADEMSKALTLSFNKARQSAITREVSEIIGGREALAEN